MKDAISGREWMSVGGCILAVIFDSEAVEILSQWIKDDSIKLIEKCIC